MPTWKAIIHAASMANEQLDHQNQEGMHAHLYLEKLLQVCQMHNAHLHAEQRMLQRILDQVKMTGTFHSASTLLPDLQPPWHRQSASHSWTVPEDDIEMVMQELKDVLSSLIATRGCHEIWRQLGSVFAKLPAPEPEIISGPGPDKLPLPQFQKYGGDGMAASAWQSQPEAATRAHLRPAPEVKLDSMTALVPQPGYTVGKNGSTANARHSEGGASSH